MSDTQAIWVLDEITNRWATIEVDDGTGRTSSLRLSLAHLPANAQEGDVFRVTIARTDGGSTISIVPDNAERERRLARSRKQVAERSPHDPGGDVTL